MNTGLCSIISQDDADASVRALTVAMSIDNYGEGGILALLSLLGVNRCNRKGARPRLMPQIHC